MKSLQEIPHSFVFRLMTLAVSLLGIHLIQAQDPGAYVGMHSDPWIPNLAHPNHIRGALIESAREGAWSDPGTWHGTVPSSDSTVLLRHRVTFDADGSADNVVLYPGSELTFATSQSTRLSVNTIQVLHQAKLQIGSAGNPIDPMMTAEIVFRDTPFDFSVDPAQYGQGILAFGSVEIHGSEVTTPFVRLSREPRAGDTTLEFSAPIQDWVVGDELILPDSRMTDPRPSRGFQSQTERVTIQGISADRRNLTVTPLQHTHPGAYNGNNQLDYLIHAGHLNRNVILRSENPDGNRAHTQFMARADIDIRYARFQDMGRTTAATLDSTEFDAQGNATKIGTNQVARYPIHTHHLIGPATPQTNGHQFTLIGNVVDGGLAPRLEKWAITIHGSHDGLIQDNIAINYAGANIVTEDGSESFNVFDHNFSVQCPAVGPLNVHDRGRAGTGFWFRGTNNYIRNNVAADHATSGYSINAYRLGNETTTIPVAQGSTERQAINMNTLPILEFANNESYGPAFYGLDLWEIGSTGETLYDVAPSVIQDFHIWHLRNRGIFFYRSHRILIDGLVIRGDLPSLRSRFHNPVGIHLQSTYRVRSYTVRNADIQGMRTGISVGLRVTPDDTPLGSRFGLPAPQDRPGIIQIEDSYLRNYFDISITTRKRGGSPRETQIRNVRFDPLNMTDVTRVGPQSTISMNFRFGRDDDAIGSDKVFVEDYQGVPGDSFQVFYREQSPSFIVPQSTTDGRTIGSPVSGLTNQENWETYGIAIAGEIAACLDDTRHPEIAGYICSENSPPVIPPPAPLPDTEAPSAPANLALVNVAENEISIEWSPSSDNVGVTGYRVYESSLQIAEVTETSFGHLNLPPGSEFLYTVTAIDAAGNESLASNALIARTQQAEPTEGLVRLTARDQFGNLVPDGAIRLSVGRFDSGSELILKYNHPYQVRGEREGVLGPWRTIVIVPAQTEIPPLFHTAGSTALDQFGIPVLNAALRVSGISSTLATGVQDTFSLPTGAGIRVRAESQGIRGPWKSVTFSEDLDAIGQRFWTVSSAARDQHEQTITDTTIRISNYSATLPTQGNATVSLPRGSRVNIRGERLGIRGAWRSFSFDEPLLDIGGLFHSVNSSPRDQHGHWIPGQLRVSSFQGSVDTSENGQLTLPLGATVNIRSERSGIRGPWRSHTFNENLTTLGHYFWTVNSTAMDQFDHPVTDARIRISSFSESVPTEPGSHVSLPLGAKVSIRAERHRILGGWDSVTFESGLNQLGKRFQTVEAIVEDSASGARLSGSINISGYLPSTIPNESVVTLPHGANVSARARVDGRNGTWSSSTIDSEVSLLTVPF